MSWSAAATVALLSAACAGSSGPSGGDTAVVSYSLTATGSAVADSLDYDNGHGTIVRQAHFGNSSIQSLTVTLPGSVSATLYIHAGGSATVTFREQWTIDGQNHADSSFASFSAAGTAEMTLPYHSL